MSDSVRPHRQQPTRLPHPWDSLGKNTGVGCHFLLQIHEGSSVHNEVIVHLDPDLPILFCSNKAQSEDLCRGLSGVYLSTHLLFINMCNLVGNLCLTLCLEYIVNILLHSKDEVSSRTGISPFNFLAKISTVFKERLQFCQAKAHFLGHDLDQKGKALTCRLERLYGSLSFFQAYFQARGFLARTPNYCQQWVPNFSEVAI